MSDEKNAKKPPKLRIWGPGHGLEAEGAWPILIAGIVIVALAFWAGG